ncbi:MAG: hypothetical protein ACT4NL_10975 [Pseudomarimonas sp.]
MTVPLDDYLNLLTQPIGHLELIVFFGASGSGKSSQLALLLDQHPELAGREVAHLTPEQVRAGELTGTQDIVVLDELQRWRDCFSLSMAMRRSRLLLVASHVHPQWLWPWRLGRRQRSFCLDPLAEKLARDMRRRGIRFSARALTDFVARFGANYTDLDIVLEQADSSDLDHALGLFLRGSTIRHEWITASEPTPSRR